MKIPGMTTHSILLDLRHFKICSNIDSAFGRLLRQNLRSLSSLKSRTQTLLDLELTAILTSNHDKILNNYNQLSLKNKRVSKEKKEANHMKLISLMGARPQIIKEGS